jgi:hypothetical protein
MCKVPEKGLCKNIYQINFIQNLPDIYAHYDDQEGLLSMKVSGIVNFEDMTESLRLLCENDKLSRNLRILEDAREARITFTEKQIPELIARIRKVEKKYQSIRHAVIHTDPINTALALLMSRHLGPERYELEVFSTESGARLWLKQFSYANEPIIENGQAVTPDAPR